jgi:hypothetical protein
LKAQAKQARVRLLGISILVKPDFSRAAAEERLRVIFCARSTTGTTDYSSAPQVAFERDDLTISATSDEHLTLVQLAPDAARLIERLTHARPPLPTIHITTSNKELAASSWQLAVKAKDSSFCPLLTAHCLLPTSFRSSSQERFQSTCQKS